MNYYIEGNAAKADKIRAAFEAKGCVMHTGIQCDLSDMIYFSLNGKVGGIKLRNLDLFKTHPDYKKLELPVEPKFKAGDKALDDMMIVTVKDVVYDQKYKEYRYSVGSYWVFESALKPYKSHYDTANFHAGMPVLVRDGDDEEWNYLFFSHYRKKLSDHFFAGGNPWFQCIPFVEDTKHLLGTTDMPREEFINW